VHGVVGRQHAIDHALGAAGGEVAMNFDHRGALRHQHRSVILDIIVALRQRGDRTGKDSGDKQVTRDQKTLHQSSFYLM
jgi:hypothetical protein